MDYANSKMAVLIAEYVHRDRDRRLLLLRYIDGHTYERIAEEVDMSVRQVQNIDYKFRNSVLIHHYRDLN